MRVVNVNDNQLWEDQTWTGVASNTRRRALPDADWNNIKKVRVVLMGDFNAYSHYWNAHSGERREAAELE